MALQNPFARLRRAARNSPWLVMSVLFHAILIIGLGVFAIRRTVESPPEDAGTVLITRHIEPPPPDEVVEPSPQILRDLIPDSDIVEITDPTDLVFPLDMPVPADQDLSKPLGDPLGADVFSDAPLASGAIGVGTGSIRGRGPTSISGHGLEGRSFQLPEGRAPEGKTRAIDEAVRHGLLWLCRHQNPDGSWGPKGMRDACDPGKPCLDPKLASNEHYDEGLTSLAVLCFLGAGLTHSSQAYLVDEQRAKRHKVGEVVKRGLEWLRERQNEDGSFSRDRAFMYNEALATMALSEAYGLTKANLWKKPAQRGVAFLEAAQRPAPSGAGRWGWRYASRMDVEDPTRATGDATYALALHDSDTSVTTWCVMALKSAQLSGLAVEPAAMQGAAEFTRFATGAEGAVGYLDAKGAGAPVVGPFSEAFTYHATAMSALGMCIRIFAEHDATDPFLPKAADRIVKDLPTAKDPGSVDYYYWYYASLALNQLDGPDNPKSTGRYWNAWNKAMVEALLELQDGSPGVCSEGGWMAGDRWGSASGTGPLYATPMNVLTLEVYYRYPNAFGRKRN